MPGTFAAARGRLAEVVGRFIFEAAVTPSSSATARRMSSAGLNLEDLLAAMEEVDRICQVSFCFKRVGVYTVRPKRVVWGWRW